MSTVSAYIESWSCEIAISREIEGGRVIVTEWVEVEGRYAQIVYEEQIDILPKDPYLASDFAHSYLTNWVKRKKREEQINKILGK